MPKIDIISTEYSKAEKIGESRILEALHSYVSRETMDGVVIESTNNVSCETLKERNETIHRFIVYSRILRHWQKSMNLVANSTMENMWERHFVDSIQFFCAMPKARKWVDIGSGAGFPGLVIAILLADAQNGGKIDLIEANNKKCAFLGEVVRKTEIQEYVEIHHGRIEDILPKLDSPEIITARAVAPLDSLLDLTQKPLSEKSCGLFAKGEKYQKELENAQKIWGFDSEIIVSQANPQKNSVGNLLKIQNLYGKI